MIRAAILMMLTCGAPALATAQSNADLSPLFDIDTAVFVGGDCAPVRKLADFMLVIECGDTNPVISFIMGMAPQYAEDFAQSDDITAACAATHGCITAESLALGNWTGGRDFHEGDFGNVSHTVLVNGSSDFEITSRALDDDVALENADIALNLLRTLVICPDTSAPNCAAE